MDKIKSILIANRSEIAIRISRTAKKMGIRTYMFRSYQEPNALYLEYADEIIDVSEDAFINIFMDVERIVAAAKEHKIDAIHPGYGFLSENPFLALECERQGVIFIGPSSQAIRDMGNKGVARKMAQDNGVPITQGSKDSIPTLEQAIEVGKSIGYPVIIKAVAGGGGKGMRVVRSEKDMALMYRMAVNEAKTVFNNSSVFIEKYVENPRHIEIQVLADKHGNHIHLFERECSIQRKHQKLLEEAPSAALSDELRKKIGADALKLSKATGYYSAGTVEFLIDSNNNHYFMEMNTRIQV
ncbi:MAG: biotin carboxylase N-terminal domain-containing protein, partial [Bacteroidales bacterium]